MKTKTKKTSAVGAVLISFLLVLISCKKWVTVDAPITSVNDETVFATDADATSVLTNLYITMSASGINSTENLTSLSLYAGLSADELILFPGVSNPAYLAHFQNELSTSIVNLPNYWSQTYNGIYVVNTALKEITESTTLTPSVKSRLLGEAYFMRGFFYFYLVNLYGDVPLNLTPDYQANSKRPRTQKLKVYEQIIADLKEAQNLLPAEYVNSKHAVIQDRVRPNKYAATALLARVYLYSGEYQQAENEATKVIDNNAQYQIEDAEKVFLKESREIIWAIPSVSSTITNTSDAEFFKPSSSDLEIPLVNFPITLNPELANRMLPVDRRKVNWIDSVSILGTKYYYSNKYKNDVVGSAPSEYAIVLRLAEQYLIRAEARAKFGRISGVNSAESDLNVIRERAGLPATEATSSESVMLEAILKERRLELFTEWGHRWFDLKRLDKANAVLGEFKGATWQTTDQLYLIPQEELDANPGIKGHQNPQ